MTIVVRRLAAAQDVSAAIILLQRFFREEGFDTPDDVIARHTQRMAELENCGLFLAEADGAAVGVATVSLEFGIEFGWSAEMGDLYVLPAWRGKAVSRALVEAVESLLRARGAKAYQVTVTPYAMQHHELVRYYERLGFASEGRLILHKRLAT
jgi:GNAT superfamily N-acetyltransferase